MDVTEEVQTMRDLIWERFGQGTVESVSWGEAKPLDMTQLATTIQTCTTTFPGTIVISQTTFERMQVAGRFWDTVRAIFGTRKPSPAQVRKVRFPAELRPLVPYLLP